MPRGQQCPIRHVTYDMFVSYWPIVLGNAVDEVVRLVYQSGKDILTRTKSRSDRSMNPGETQ